MRAGLFARIVFGASAVLYGVIALWWHDADTWQNLTRLWSLPFGTIVGAGLMVAQIAGGLGVMFPRTARLASIVLGVVYVIFSLVCLSGIISAVTSFLQYDSFFEQFALECGALAVYAATGTKAAQATAIGRTARIGMGLCAVMFMLAQMVYLHFTASLVPTWIPPSQTFWAVLTTIAFGLAAIAMLINHQARLALRLMALMLALFGVLVWVPALIAHPEAHGNWSEFAINFQITGAAWIVGELRSF